MIEKIKSKIQDFRWYLNNQQAGHVQKAVSYELTEILKYINGDVE